MKGTAIVEVGQGAVGAQAKWMRSAIKFKATRKGRLHLKVWKGGFIVIALGKRLFTGIAEVLFDGPPWNAQNAQCLRPSKPAYLAQPVHGLRADIQEFADLFGGVAQPVGTYVLRHLHICSIHLNRKGSENTFTGCKSVRPGYNLPTMETDMDATMAALRRGDDETWGKYYPVFYGVALNVIRRSKGRFSNEAEDDLAAASIEVLMDGIKTVKDIDHAKRRLALIAQHKAIDEIRANSTQMRETSKNRSLEEIMENSGDMALPLAQPVPPEIERKVEPVRRALALLEPKYRNLLFDYYLEEYTQAELAEKYGLPEGTVATNCRRGKMQLDQILKQMAQLKEYSPDSRL